MTRVVHRWRHTHQKSHTHRKRRRSLGLKWRYRESLQTLELTSTLLNSLIFYQLRQGKHQDCSSILLGFLLNIFLSGRLILLFMKTKVTTMEMCSMKTVELVLNLKSKTRSDGVRRSTKMEKK